MAKRKTTKKDNTIRNVGIGLGTAAVAAAGAYFFYGSSNAKKNRQKLKSWMMMAKAEVLEALEEAKSMTQEEYEDLVEDIAEAYAVLQTATKKDIVDFKKEMKDHWKQIEKSTKTKVKKAATKATKRAKKVAKKVVQKRKK
jgi:high-affinity Fe2+/Pb2+ permease